MKERLIEIVKESLVKNIDYTNRLAERITDDLLAQGVIVPPCKVGDTVYYLTSIDTEEELDVTEIFCGVVVSVGYDTSLWIHIHYDNGLTYYHSASDFGNTVFLTKEEAEKALAEREGEIR